MILQQVINGTRRGQQIYIKGDEMKDVILPVCNSVDERPTAASPSFFITKTGDQVSWVVIEG